MTSRPMLDKSISTHDFKQFYWKKAELIIFCRENKLSTQGSKQELSERIELYLRLGKKLTPAPIKRVGKGQWDSEHKLARDTPVLHYKSDPATRQFFQNEIGPHFRFKADVLTWIKTKLHNKEKLTYGDIIHHWESLERLQNSPDFKREIPKQFQYNQFMRDWKEAKAGKGAKDAWKKISSMPVEPTFENYMKALAKDG